MVVEFRPRARPDVETHVLPDGSCLLFDPVTLEGHAFDIVGALVWEYCDGTVTRQAIARSIAELVPQDEGLGERVMQVFDELYRHGLLQVIASAEEGPEVGPLDSDAQG